MRDLLAQGTIEIARETYIWGYPLVLADTTRQVMTNVEAPTGAVSQAPLNKFAHAEKFPDATYREARRPNFDTLYSSAWLDLEAEPLVITMPDTDRYHVFEMADGWMEVFTSLGSRTTGGRGGSFLIAGPEWRGDVPKDMELLRSTTAHVFIIGRIQTNGVADYDFVHKLQDQIKLTPLSQWGKNCVPPKGKVDPKVDMKTPPMIAVNKMDAEAFFTALMEALKKNPPHVHDQGVVARMKRLGLEPGKSLHFKDLPAPVQQALRDGVTKGMQAIRKRVQLLARAKRNGWWMPTGAIGYYGADYEMRAVCALYGGWYNRPEDAIYPIADTDGEGQPLSGARRYMLHFPRGQTPPVDGFWSVTLYDDNGFPVKNTLKRHALGDRDKLQFNDDGSLTLYVQHQSPGTGKEANWLPAPEGAFELTLRCYSPRAELISGEWVPPPVQQVK
jgi:hypothetical protein